jgi:hypothetical protein
MFDLLMLGLLVVAFVDAVGYMQACVAMILPASLGDRRP